MLSRYTIPIALIAAGLAGCSASSAVVAAGSTVVGTAGSVASTAASAVPAGANALSGAVASAGSPGANGASSDGSNAEIFAAGTTLSAASVAANQFTTGTPQQALGEGLDTCLDGLRTETAFAENLASRGWAAGLESTPTDDGSKARSVQKASVRGTILPNGGCTFRVESVALARATQIARKQLDEKYDGAFVVGSPVGRTGPCDGFTVNLGARKARLYFTSATGDHCTRGGSGVTVTLL